MTRPVIENPQLDGSTFRLAGSLDFALMFHGFTATTVEVRPMASYLNGLGFSILAPLLPGHGSWPEDMLAVTWKDWVDCAEDAYRQVKPQAENTFVLGESMGGLLALYLAWRHPEIRGIALYAPALRIPGMWKAHLAHRFLKIVPKGYLEDENAPDPDVLPWQGYNVLPVPAVHQLGVLQNKIVKALASIRQPVLIFQGDLDRTIDPRGSQTIYERIGSTRKELVRLQRSAHCILLDRELKDVEVKTAHFLQACLIE